MTWTMQIPQINLAKRLTLILSCSFGIAACDVAPGLVEGPAQADPARPVPVRARTIEPPAQRDTISAYFQSLEAQRLGNGLLRETRDPPDLPFSDRDLEEIFVKIALFDEYTFIGNRIVERATPSSLRRWEVPVRMGLEFGASVPSAIQRTDRALVARYASRLGRLTGHPVALAGSNANFHVLVLNEAERQASDARLRELVPGIDEQTVALIQDLPLSVSCLVLAFSRSGTDVYTDAIAVIRAELPDLSRRACYYEELAQGMGLPNDSPRARPSLFNDTAEFAVLTVLDEKLLRMLYDPRLRPGMREVEARPIIRRIAQELMGAQS